MGVEWMWSSSVCCILSLSLIISISPVDVSDLPNHVKYCVLVCLASFGQWSWIPPFCMGSRIPNKNHSRYTHSHQRHQDHTVSPVASLHPSTSHHPASTVNNPSTIKTEAAQDPPGIPVANKTEGVPQISVLCFFSCRTSSRTWITRAPTVQASQKPVACKAQASHLPWIPDRFSAFSVEVNYKTHLVNLLIANDFMDAANWV